jgi:GR25 family glycosyltransferase involved in LPS biosynthesis
LAADSLNWPLARMDCYYVNLDAAEERKDRVEKNFAVCKKPGWTLTRFPAIDKVYVEANAVPGATRPGEKGCFLSHQFLMEQRLGDDETYMIMEDDAQFGVRTCTLVDMVLKRNKDLDWDILYTDVCIPNMVTMFDLLKYRRELRAKKTEVAFMDLAGVGFAGTTAYLVNGKSKRKVYEALKAYRPIDLPYDLFLRQQSHGGALKIFSLFPFVTTVSDFCNESQIKGPGENHLDMAWNMYRNMIWIERNLNSCKPSLDSLKAAFCPDEPPAEPGDEELAAFKTLFSSMAAIQA